MREKKVYIAGLDCSISDAIKFALEGDGIIVPEERDGRPSLELINFSKAEIEEIYEEIVAGAKGKVQLVIKGNSIV